MFSVVLNLIVMKEMQILKTCVMVIYLLVEMSKGKSHRNVERGLKSSEGALLLTEERQERGVVLGFHQAVRTGGIRRFPSVAGVGQIDV